MAQILKGTEVSTALNEKLRIETEALHIRGIVPTLAIVRVGERADDISYEKGAEKRANAIGVAVQKYILPQDATQSELVETIRRINADKTIHGALLLRPLPKHMNEELVRSVLLPEKDVDGITDGSLAGVFSGSGRGFAPCTAQACMEILDYYQIPTQGKTAVVIGRSLVVGKPVAMMLIQKNATVTVCHTKSEDIPSIAKKADILIVAAGRARVVGATYAGVGQTVIDVGIHFDENGKMTGDVDYSAVEPLVRAITPVPGGVGAVTTTVLIGHVIEAANRAANLD